MHPTTAATAAAPQPGRYAIDLAHSCVTFRTRHLFGLAPVRGTFAIRCGVADISDPLTGSSICAEIDASSFRTGSTARDRSVLSARFLDPTRYPAITFQSEEIEPGRKMLTGTLTVRDTTMPVTLAITTCEVSRGSFTVRARTKIARTQFGITAARGLAARDLDLTVNVRWVRA
jgi:polyisoprenoid-binding protein YceI